ncbi:MAG: polyprenyl synthetase family protein [Chloroflexota bacterium]
MTLSRLTPIIVPAIEDELRRAIEVSQGPGLEGLCHMLAYHMGWEGEAAGPKAQGKRVRPLLVILCAAASNDTPFLQQTGWQKALPAAATVELIHNFSLIHDDIEDNSPLRRGRPTLWKKWNIAQAINTGDTLFTIAHLATLRLAETTTPDVTLEAVRVVQQTCLHLTQGQYLDIEYATRSELQPSDYWPMVAGKTAALLACCTELGALIADSCRRTSYREFGRLLGLAFQVQDDLLGIWGDAQATGKSTDSDLVEGKKSLPVLYGLHCAGAFAQRWASGPIAPDEVPALARQLETEGARAYAQAEADRLTQEALQALEIATPQGDAGEALYELARKLLKREQ